MLLDSLNPEQRRAVEHFEGPILVLAGAGSGKTRVLTTRVWHLITEHGVPAARIMAVTFTNKAAGEMRERVAAMLSDRPRGAWIGTFHAIGARLLRRHAPELGWSRGFAIRDAEQALREVKRAQRVAQVDIKRWSPKVIRSHISDAKNRLMGPGAFEQQYGDGPDLTLKTVARVYPVYQSSLREQDAMDFDDLLLLPVRLLANNQSLRERYQERFPFILVDEYQDTNQAQFRFLELLASDHRNLMVVGDDDQSIYGWRGADVRNILDFEHAFPGARVVKLERNYRSTPVILDAANAAIRQNKYRKEKTMRTERVGGDPVTAVEAADETDEARWIVQEIERSILERPQLDHRDFGVLYRTNAQARALEDRFWRRGIPYQVIGGVRFYERREIQDVLAYLRLIANPRDLEAFERVVNSPRRGIGPVSQSRVSTFAREQGIEILAAAERANAVPGLTAPARKGLRAFVSLIRECSLMAAHCSAGEVLQLLIDELGLVQLLRAEGRDGEDRAENVRELVSAAQEFEADLLELDADDREPFTDLGLFLQHVALVADVDRHDSNADAVTLMTVHSAKGLEFPVVFMSGMEEGLFPLDSAYDEEGRLEEERRLFYVGMTRACKTLYLTHAWSRRRAGTVRLAPRSTFMDALPNLKQVRTDRTRTSRRHMESRSHRGGSGRRSRSSPPRWGNETGPEAGFNQDRPSYVKGESVVHQTFGSGVIVALSGFGPDLKVTVDFAGVGRKRLVVRYAGLEKDYP